MPASPQARRFSHSRRINLGSIAPTPRERVADLLAFCIVQDGVLGLCQGVAEMGPLAWHTATIRTQGRWPAAQGVAPSLEASRPGTHGGGATLIGLRLPEGRVSFRSR
jgi:hypothetical protein